MPFPMTIVPAADGYLGVNVLTQTQWELLCAYTGRSTCSTTRASRRPPTGPRTPPSSRRCSPSGRPTSRRRRRSSTPRAGASRSGTCRTVDEVTTMDQHVGRSFFTAVPGPTGTTLARADGAVPRRRRAPPRPTRSRARRRPRPSRHLGGIRSWAGSVRLPGRSRRDDPRPVGGRRSTAGRWRGSASSTCRCSGPVPLAADLCAQYGADVVKVESVQRVDGWRGLVRRRRHRELEPLQRRQPEQVRDHARPHVGTRPGAAAPARRGGRRARSRTSAPA